MKPRFLLLASVLMAASALIAPAQEPAEAARQATDTAAAAAVVTGHAQPRTPDFLEHMVDLLLEVFDIKSSGNTATHYAIALLITLVAYVLRRVVTTWIFGFFKIFAARTKTTLDDKRFPALEGPVKAAIVVIGTVASLKVLKLSPTADQTLGYAYTLAFSFVLFWGFLRAFNTVLDHLHEIELRSVSHEALETLVPRASCGEGRAGVELDHDRAQRACALDAAIRRSAVHVYDVVADRAHGTQRAQQTLALVASDHHDADARTLALGGRHFVIVPRTGIRLSTKRCAAIGASTPLATRSGKNTRKFLPSQGTHSSSAPLASPMQIVFIK